MSKKIAVIGAGAAGLMAALDLTAAGHDVVVLEARGRVGGRIHTVGFDNGLWANAGAEWLNSTDMIAHELCQRYGLELTPQYGSELGVVDGVLRDDLDGIAPIVYELEQLASELTSPAEPWLDPLARQLDCRNVSDWLNGLAHLDPDTRRLFATYVGGNDMVGLDELSLASAVLAHAGSDADDRSSRLTLGTAALPAAMAAELGDDRIHLDARVTTIRHDQRSVTVATASDEYVVDAVVLTTPLPALRRIVVQPAIEFPWVGQGRGGKLLVPYARRDRIDAAVGQAANCDIEAVYHTASHQDHDGAVLAAYSRNVVDDAQILTAISKWFPTIGDPIAPPVRAWWSDEPESGTTYSARRPGDLRTVQRLQTPFGRIHLAGEHTQVHNGYVESALASGRRVARAIDHDHR